MILLRPKSFRVGLVLLAVLLMPLEHPSGVFAGDGITLGDMKTCAHGVTGTVTALNKRQIKITKFNYDGKGRLAFFHAMKNGAGAIFADPTDKFHAIENSLQSCGSLGFDKDGGRAHKDAEVTLILPDNITEYETIGIYDHYSCTNFGFLKLEHKDKTYADVPPSVNTDGNSCEIPNGKFIQKLEKIDEKPAAKCDKDGTIFTNYDCTPAQRGAGGKGAAGSVGCIAGGVLAVSLLSAMK